MENEWKTGKIKKFAKGGSAIWFEGAGTEDKPEWTPVKPTLQGIVKGAGWGAELKWKEGTWSEDGGNKKGVVALEILKKGDTIRRTPKGDFRTPEQVTMDNCIANALKYHELRLAYGQMQGGFDNRGLNLEITIDQVKNTANEFFNMIMQGGGN